MILRFISSTGVNQFLLNENAIEHTVGALIKFEVRILVEDGAPLVLAK
jgi:hypothetical protein